MKFGNRYNLPSVVVQWASADDYDYVPDVLSATTLLKPTRTIVLEKRHYDEIEIDVSDRIAIRLGDAIHDSFEKVPMPNVEKEIRLFAKVSGKQISGKFDMLIKQDDGHKLVDLKSTSVWTWIYGSRREDYLKQLSIYRYLAEENGYDVLDVASVIYLFTDWSRSKAKQGGNYPPIRIVVEDIELMSIDDTKRFIEGRLKEFNKFMDKTEEELPPCNKEDLWQGDDKFAVMKGGRKSALKVFDDKESAMNMLRTLDHQNHCVEDRLGKVNRCNYCNVTKWCSQFKELQDKGLIAE